MTAPAGPALTAYLREQLLAARNSDGGWPYVRGKRSRIEPTSWALIALASPPEPTHAATLFRPWPREGARLVDGPGLPPSNLHNALAAIALLQDGPDGNAQAGPIVDALVASRAVTTPQSQIIVQDNSLQGWGWVDGTTSWIEPTAWCVLLLKHLHRRGAADPATAQRIAVGDRLLLDRACRDGGWNYGNSIVYGKELWPYAPATALALIALQDLREHPIVRQAMYRLEKDARKEGSPLALGLATLCLRVYGVSADAMQEALSARISSDARSDSSNDILPLAIAVCALGNSRAVGALTI